MRLLVYCVFFISLFPAFGQHAITGRVVNAKTGKPLPYASLEILEGNRELTNIDGSFSMQYQQTHAELKVSYVGFADKNVPLSPEVKFVEISLSPSTQNLETIVLTSTGKAARRIVSKAIARKPQNDPNKALNAYTYKSYNKFIIDNQDQAIRLKTDSTNTEISTLINTARAYLSEKVTQTSFSKQKGEKETVIGLNTAGFKEPIYNVLSLSINPISLYKKDYPIFETDYAGPLANNALQNYTYKILDTTAGERPAYVLYFKPKRERAVAGLEGVLYLDTLSYAIQKAKAQLLGEIKLEVNHNYTYFKEQDVWFPTSQTTTIRPGSGGEDISVFGGGISLGNVQQRNSLMNTVLSDGKLNPRLYLSSTITNYDFQFNSELRIKNSSAKIEVNPEAIKRPASFWEDNRQIPFTSTDQATAKAVDSIIKTKNIERKLEIKKSLARGYYPVGFWDFNLSKFFKFNNYEGVRVGLGGQTNEKLSEDFNLGGYIVYGFKDHSFKYNVNSSYFLNNSSGTQFNLGYTRDIQEVGSFHYLTSINKFSILQPRFVNINFFYNYKSIDFNIKHRIGSKINTQLQLTRASISQLNAYAYLYEDKLYSDYILSEATFSFLWRPFAEFLQTPTDNVLIERKGPEITGQIERSFKDFLNGDFNFTRFGLKIDYTIKNLDLSQTEFILQGNYAAGTIPLTHTFHAFPNNPQREKILRRFSVAGQTSFETMYFNEFFSDRLAMFHVRHQLRPLHITPNFNPELVLISRVAIGDIGHIERHQFIEFKSLKHGYLESGFEINKIFAGLGLSAAYRYGAYHYPKFSDNIAFKFTLNLQL